MRILSRVSRVLQRTDEELYVNNAAFGRYSLATCSRVRHLPADAWDREAGDAVSAPAVGYLMLGHERHRRLTGRCGPRPGLVRKPPQSHPSGVSFVVWTL